ncbi:MAG TPA: radical SAM protein, partial [Candidatus Cloacimonadota bacterium]|nr:radical SAM protein [Candidatus Cloacimonadota bacterium]
MNNPRPDKQEILKLLSLTDQQEIQALYRQAYDVKKQYVGTKVYFRGIIELSNYCVKNCYYCGIRKDNPHVQRFSLCHDEVVESALWAFKQNYGSVVIQSGERSDDAFTEFIEEILFAIKEKSAGQLGITLSLGEQSPETYRRWYAAGAHRYLLRIESSNPDLYSKLHPADHDWQQRLNCLRTLREIGYQTGTGVMIGLPFQSLEHLADDVLFFYDEDIDMIGMGPYIPHEETPLYQYATDYQEDEHLE